MDKLTQKQQQVYDYIKEAVDKNGYPPTVREIALKMGLKSASTVQSHIETLIGLGYIRRDSTKPRTIEIVGNDSARILSMENVYVPILGNVAAGQPLYAEQNIEGYFPISTSMINRGEEYFMLNVRGNSMTKIAMYDGDKILVRRQSYVDNGEVAVILVGNSSTVKRFYKEDGYYRLQPENDLLEPIIVNNAEVIGKVMGIFRGL